MTDGAGAAWRELPPEIDRDEPAAWLARIAAPVAVTGATGFVGSHLLDALVTGGVRLRVLVRDPSRLQPGVSDRIELVQGNLDDTGALERLVSDCRTVFHVAGVVRAPDAATFDHGNRVGTEHVVAALTARAADAHLVYVSSLAASGPSETPEGHLPEDEPRPVSAYGRSKLGAERAVRAFGGPWTVVRPPAIYGPRDTDVLQFFRMASWGWVALPAGERYVTVAHVADVVRALLAAGALGKSRRTFHPGEPAPARLDDLLRAIADAGGVRARIVPTPPFVLRGAGLLGDALHALGLRRVAITSDKAGELLARHWSSRTAESLRALGLDGFVPFAAGAAATWAWYRERGWIARAKIPWR